MRIQILRLLLLLIHMQRMRLLKKLGLTKTARRAEIIRISQQARKYAEWISELPQSQINTSAKVVTDKLRSVRLSRKLWMPFHRRAGP